MKIRISKIQICLTLLLAITVSLFTCCQNKSTKPFDDEKYWNHNWSTNSIINHIVQSRKIDDKLYTVSPDFIRGYDDITGIHNFDLMSPINAGDTGFGNKPVMSDDFAVFPHYETSQKLFIREIVKSEVEQYNSIIISTDLFGEQFKDYVFMTNINPRKGFGVFNGNRFVTAIAKSFDGTNNDAHIVYFDIGYNPYSGLRVVEKGIWNIPILSPGVNIIYDIEFCNDQFYVSYVRDYGNPGYPSMGYLILSNDMTHDVCYTQIGDNRVILVTFFHFDGKLFAHFSNGDIGYTIDGENWTLLTNMYATLSFKQLDNFMFIYLNSSIGFFADVFGETYLNVVPKSNLGGATITGLHKINDYLVITTTNGIYYKNFDQVIKDARNNKNTNNNRSKNEELFINNDFYDSIF